MYFGKIQEYIKMLEKIQLWKNCTLPFCYKRLIPITAIAVAVVGGSVHYMHESELSP